MYLGGHTYWIWECGRNCCSNLKIRVEGGALLEQELKLEQGQDQEQEQEQKTTSIYPASGPQTLNLLGLLNCPSLRMSTRSMTSTLQQPYSVAASTATSPAIHVVPPPLTSWYALHRVAGCSFE